MLIGGMELQTPPKDKVGRAPLLLVGFILGALVSGLGVGIPWAAENKAGSPPAPPSTEVITFTLSLSNSRLRERRSLESSVSEIQAAVANTLNVASSLIAVTLNGDVATIQVTTEDAGATRTVLRSPSFAQSVASDLPGYSSVVASTPSTALKTVLDGWNNHFAAFGTKDVPRILLDYTETSVLQSYEQCEGRLTVATGLTQIGAFFTGLFAGLDTSQVTAPVVDVTTRGDDVKQVYLIWKAPLSGIESAQDTFIFDDDYKIARQNIAWTKTPCTNATADAVGVQASWDNHFAAFGAKDVPRILLDYTNTSVLTSFEECDCQLTTAVGLPAIGAFFTNLFTALPDYSDLTTPVIQTTADPKMTYLIWTKTGSQH
jgi:hypothetical protein